MDVEDAAIRSRSKVLLFSSPPLSTKQNEKKRKGLRLTVKRQLKRIENDERVKDELPSLEAKVRSGVILPSMASERVLDLFLSH